MEQTVIPILAIVNIGLLTYGCYRVAGTTLLEPGLWAIVAVVGVAGSELAITALNVTGQPYWTESLRYAVAMGTFCPAMAVLGAKRPQDRGWQWVVLTLWIVLTMPAAQAALFRTEARVTPFVAWKLLVVALLLLQGVNYVFSRHRWAAALWITAQVVLLRPHWFPTVGTGPVQAQVALGVMLAAIFAVWLRHRSPQTVGTPLESVWLGFTDMYGTFWAYRLMGLINQTAAAAHWPVRLMPSGFAPENGQALVNQAVQLSPKVQLEIRQAMRNTLRRFLSERQLEEHLGG